MSPDRAGLPAPLGLAMPAGRLALLKSPRSCVPRCRPSPALLPQVPLLQHHGGAGEWPPSPVVLTLVMSARPPSVLLAKEGPERAGGQGLGSCSRHLGIRLLEQQTFPSRFWTLEVQDPGAGTFGSTTHWAVPEPVAWFSPSPSLPTPHPAACEILVP